MLAAALGGLDAFVFTAGIGENSAVIRARIAAKLAWLGAILDEQANTARALRISAPDSRVGLYVIPTDEELMIANHTLATLRPEISSSARLSPGPRGPSLTQDVALFGHLTGDP
jgi:acetate kinase